MLFLVHQHAYCYIVNNRNDLIGPENMGMDTKIDFLSFYWKAWGIYDLPHVAQVAIMFLLRNIFNEDASPDSC